MTAPRTVCIRPPVAAALALAAAILLGGCTGPADQDLPPAAPSSSPDAPLASPADDAFPTSGAVEAEGSTRPALRWSAVEGAGVYRLVVVPAAGPSWAWSGEETEIVLGGGDVDRVGPGFSLGSAATVYWLAADNSGAVLATDRLELPAP